MRWRTTRVPEPATARRYRQGAVLVVAAVLTSGGLVPEPVRPAGELVPDSFAGSTPGSQWERVLPHGVGAVQVAGGREGEGWLALSVPAGVNHNPWTVNDAVRAVQRVRDEDLRLAAGFASVPFARYQLQGLIVAASASTFLRYGVHHDGAGLRLFVSRTVDGAATVLADTRLPELDEVHLRVERDQDDWTLSWSPDRASWSVGASFGWPVQVAEVGPFVGNYDAAGNAPAYTALVDYVVDAGAPPPAEGAVPAGSDISPPSVSGPQVHTRAGSARLSWVTGELTTGRVEYGATGGYGERSEPTRIGLGHGLTLTGLAPGTRYHYRLVVTDLSGNQAVTGGGSFTTAAAGPEHRFTSDDFTAAELAPVWQRVTPLGVGTVGPVRTGDSPGQLALAVPAGHNHDPWTVNDSVRAVQLVADEALGVEAQFASMPERKNQMQGLAVGESRVTFVRFGVHHDGSGLRLFASVTVQGTPTVVTDVGLPALDTVRLRIERARDDWVLSWSAGGPWAEVAAFTQRMRVTEVGPFAGSYRAEGDPPAYTALVSYVRATRSADDPAEAPQVRDLTVDATTNHVLLRWSTDRTATSAVEYGTDGAYGSTVEVPAPGTVHRLRLTGLARGVTYHFRVVATDAAGLATRTDDATFTTPARNTGPTIDVWYGPDQVVNATAQAQTWFNVLGNVSDPDGVASLSYSLNGGEPRSLTLGPDDRRLQWAGDFNADIEMAELGSGENTVTLTATDGEGLVTSRTVTVTDGSGDGLSLPYQLAWQPGVSPAAQAQMVDGAWTVTGDGLRTGITGYDRIAVLGDIGWTDYEVTVPITVHELGPAAYSYLSGGPVIGLGLRWQGHTAVDRRQPAWGFHPTGAFAWYRFHEDGPRFELIGNDNGPTQSSSPPFALGTTYLLKVRVETVEGGTLYQAKLWPADGVEPEFWTLAIEEDQGPQSGSVALIAHQLHGTFGQVVVRPL